MDSQLALSISLEFVAAGCGYLPEVFQRVRRFHFREPLLKDLRAPVTELGAHFFCGCTKLLDLP
jgi:hypothetical protein